ncbi:hypothetical protein QE430_000202 [Microbacterium testaceum]|nr:hypothetical protein [Microbacterium testaceum]
MSVHLLDGGRHVDRCGSLLNGNDSTAFASIAIWGPDGL